MERYIRICDMCKNDIEPGKQSLRVKFSKTNNDGTSTFLGELDVCGRCEHDTDMSTFVNAAIAIRQR